MSDPHATLRLLLDRHQRDRDTAFAAERRARAASDAASRQADQLEQYRRDFEQRWNARFRVEGTVELLRCHRSFCDRLSAALDQQASIVAYTATQADVARAALCDAELQCASVEKLIERRLQEARRQLERLDQRQTDEAAARVAWRRIGAARPAPFG